MSNFNKKVKFKKKLLFVQFYPMIEFQSSSSKWIELLKSFKVLFIKDCSFFQQPH